MVKHGDPKEKLGEPAELIKRLDIPNDRVKMVCRSVRPNTGSSYLKNTLMEEEVGKRNILIATPSFVTDCLETIEEDQVQNYQAFRAAGGQGLDVVPALNDQPAFASFIAQFVKEQVQA